MTGLMMVFLLIAITYMVKVEAASEHIREIAVLYERMKVELYDDLKREFEEDLPRWGPELDRDSTIRFKEPDVLFPIGRSELKNLFKNILNEFFPRYVDILVSAKYRDAVEEIRIEGHTSSIWANLPPDQAYFQNMTLSRTARGAPCNTCSRYLVSGVTSAGYKATLRRTGSLRRRLSRDPTVLRTTNARNGSSSAYAPMPRVTNCQNNRDGQMRLPDFTYDAGLIALRHSMGAVAPGWLSPSYRPDGLTLAELEQLATDGKDVSIDDIVVLEDSTLSYKDSRVLVYIRDFSQDGGRQWVPRSHVADCSTLQHQRQQNHFDHYVVATRDDGFFQVNLIGRGKKVSGELMRLDVCQNCLDKLGFDSFS